MNGMGTVFTPPGEIIEASFSNGKINDGKIKILVIIIIRSFIYFSILMESITKEILSTTSVMVKELITILMEICTKENSWMISVLVKAKCNLKMEAHLSVSLLMIKLMAMEFMRIERATAFNQ